MGWQLSPDGTPTHVARDVEQTVDPSMTFQSQHFPCRTILIWKEGNKYEMFECGEYWDVKPVVNFWSKSQVVDHDVACEACGSCRDWQGDPVCACRP